MKPPTRPPVPSPTSDDRRFCANARWRVSGVTSAESRLCELGPYMPVPTPTSMPTATACHGSRTARYSAYATALLVIANTRIRFGPTRSAAHPATNPDVTAVMPPEAIAAAAMPIGSPRPKWRYSTRKGATRPLPKKFTYTPTCNTHTRRGRPGSSARMYRSSQPTVWTVTFVTTHMDARWLVLTWRLPSDSSTPRVATWRTLKRVGAVLLTPGAAVVPYGEDLLEQLDWLAQSIEHAGGEAWVLPVGRLSEREEA